MLYDIQGLNAEMVQPEEKKADGNQIMSISTMLKEDHFNHKDDDYAFDDKDIVDDLQG